MLLLHFEYILRMQCRILSLICNLVVSFSACIRFSLAVSVKVRSFIHSAHGDSVICSYVIIIIIIINEND